MNIARIKIKTEVFGYVTTPVFRVIYYKASKVPSSTLKVKDRDGTIVPNVHQINLASQKRRPPAR